MSPVLVKGGTAAGIGGGIATVTYLSVKSSEASEDSVILKFLFEKSTFEQDYKEQDVVGKAYGRFLLDTDAEENKDYWENLENKLIAVTSEDSFDSAFKSVREKGDKHKNLKNVCSELYKSKKLNDFFDNTSFTTLGVNMWDYCSGFGDIPTLASAYTGSTGANEEWWKQDDNKNYLLSTNVTTTYPNNKLYWEHIYKRILKKAQAEANASTSLDKKFRDVKTYEQLITVCEDAYSTKPKEESDNYGENARKFCSLVPSKLTKYPTAT